jgi:hypothetical protein
MLNHLLPKVEDTVTAKAMTIEDIKTTVQDFKMLRQML